MEEKHYSYVPKNTADAQAHGLPPQNKNAAMIARSRRAKRRKARRRALHGAVLTVLIGLTGLLLMRHFTNSAHTPGTAGLLPDMLAQETLAEPSELNKNILAIGDDPMYPLETQAPYTIAVDAGHGGSDGGAEGIILESKLTETTAAELHRLLSADANYNPVLAHAFGEGASIGDRADACNAAKASLLVSIHGNFDSNSDSYGFECFATPPGRLYHEMSLRFAMLVAQGMSEAGARLRGENGVRYAYYVQNSSGGYNKKNAESTDLTVRDELTFGVIEKVGCPALLIEQCFVSNGNDTNTWGYESGCKKAARVYYEAICAYFGTAPTAV